MNFFDDRETPSASDVSGADGPSAPAVLDEPTGIPPPRLGIIHLLAWITVAAVLFGMERSAQVLENASSHPDRFIPHYQALDAIHVVGIATGVVGLVTLVRWRLRGQCRSLAPGHWILIAEIIPMLLLYGGAMARRVLIAILDINAQTIYLPLIALSALTAVAQLFLFAAVRFRCARDSGWQWIFRLLAVGCASQMTLSILLFLFVADWLAPPFPLVDFLYPAPASVHGIVSSVTVAYAAYNAFRVRRDWLHGVGVALIFVNGLTWVGYGVASQLFRLTSLRDCLKYILLQ